MNQVSQSDQQNLTTKLARYGWVAGTGALLSPLAFGEILDFDPDGGLPIVVDNSITFANAVEIDLDDDQVTDYKIYYATYYGNNGVYGGGFVIAPSYPAYVQYSRPINYDSVVAPRHDLTEVISANRNNRAFYDFGSATSYIDANSPGPSVPAYTPFRNNPGFLGVSLEGVLSAGQHAGALKLVVNSAGTQLTILKGSYRTDQYDLRLDDGILFSDGFEGLPESDYFPTDGLQGLALGSEE